ncbi:sensor domain-containing phosphodiesterase [Erwinia oleae]|uniref:sensor domain-containing phosphodiesterase n=1 Tax=Erwinia oleae TaxID=796334 RepID=UPI000907D7BE|nr:sensor domain-containing phosphodiesterase [Erwinia oleae]
MLINLRGNATQRQNATDALKMPDENRDDVLKQFVCLASESLGIPGGFISVIDDSHQFIRAAHNIALCQTTREDAFCRYVVDSGEVMVVTDTLLDPRFTTHPLVVGPPRIRFYAGAPLKNREGVILGTLCVTDRVPHRFPRKKIRMLETLARLAMTFLETWHSAGFTDVATGLPNRQRLIRHLQLLSTSEQRAPLRLTLIDCIDMPRAYELARALGMAPVEALLRDIGGLLRERLELAPEDILYTVATGRYAILASAEGRFSAQNVVDKLRYVSARPEDGVAMDLSIHAGEVCFDPTELPAQEALRRAVSALHEAINLHVGARSFNELSDARRNGDFRLMNDLAAALQTGTGGLYLVYQPKVSLPSGRPVGLEALIRWRHPEHGELSPAGFLPVAQFTNLMNSLTDWVVGETIRQLKIWSDTPCLLPVSVNVSVSDLSRSDFTDTLEARMAQAGLSTSLLGIECLETEKATENPAALANMEGLRKQGFRISLDDFGAGYSNIGYLRQMPIDVIKLDRALVSGLTIDPGSRIIAASVIRMLKDLNYVVVAEGVEDRETLMVLEAYGCDQVQGFYFSRPLPPAELEKWLQQQPQSADPDILPLTGNNLTMSDDAHDPGLYN